MRHMSETLLRFDEKQVSAVILDIALANFFNGITARSGSRPATITIHFASMARSRCHRGVGDSEP